MADYKEMYLTLFRRVSKVISLLQEAQQQTEEIFLSSDETTIQILPSEFGGGNEAIKVTME